MADDGILVCDFTARQGSRFERALSWFTAGPGWPQDADDKTPFDFTGWTGAMQVRLGPERDAVLSLTSGEGITIGGGTVTITIDGSALDGVPPMTYGYDLELCPPGGQPEAMIEGAFTVKPGWTR